MSNRKNLRLMRKFILFLFFTIAICGIWTVQQLQFSTTSVSSLVLSEFEALADKTPSNLFNCSCGLIWGSGCRRDNWGVDCATSDTELCSDFDGNCSGS